MIFTKEERRRRITAPMRLALTLLVCALGPIVIDSNSITSIGQSDRKPDIDLSEETVMPGWIGACLPVTDSDSIMEAESKAFRLLKNGFTTVVAPSTRLRDLIEDQRWAGPRMLPHGNCDSANRFLAAARQGSPITQEELAGVTSRAAQEFGISDRTGVLIPGMLADLVATHGNPLTDGAALRSIVCVLKEGHIYREPNPPERLKLKLRR